MAKSITLENIPEDVYMEVLAEQSKIKQHIGTQFSLSKTIIKMIADYAKCRKDNSFVPNHASRR